MEYLIKFGQIVAYPALFAIVFAESGLLFGFFLPGDSLLFTAGFLASRDLLNIYLLVPLLFIAAVLGDSVGYTFGHKVGRRLFNKKDSLLFHKDNLLKAQQFYEKHGKKTIIIARFMPIVRTFAPIVAGVGDMEYRTFLVYNVIGGFFWAVGVTLLGFFLGQAIPNVEKYFELIIIIIVVISILPSVYHILKEEDSRKGLIKLVKKILHL